jgi:hypothetical protein
MLNPRNSHTATLLANGMVLVTGGLTTNGYATNAAELYNPSNETWTATSSLLAARRLHTATLLFGGQVLVAGGLDFNANGMVSAELRNPLTGLFTNTGSMTTPRSRHTATLLPSGKVLVAGGLGSTLTATAELYDPVTGTWTTTRPMNTARQFHTATMLPNGKVLVAGGYNSGELYSSELYDPVDGTWTTNTMYYPHNGHTATLLPDGKVLVAGGTDPATGGTAELYDPAAGTWKPTRIMLEHRSYHTETLLPNGQVLVTGGNVNNGLSNDTTNTAELYDPASGTWAITGAMSVARVDHTATLLPNGNVLVAGGDNSTPPYYPADAELFDVGLGFGASSRPQVASGTSPVNLGTTLALIGSKFRGLSEASGGNGAQNSSSDCPVLELLSLGNEQTSFLATTNWSTTSFASLPVTNCPPGYALATVFVNGIPSVSAIVLVGPEPGPIILANPAKTAGGAFQFSFTNTPGALFTVLATTNLPTASSNWTVLGRATETVDGQFQFSDTQATKYHSRLYRVSSP